MLTSSAATNDRATSSVSGSVCSGNPAKTQATLSRASGQFAGTLTTSTLMTAPLLIDAHRFVRPIKEVLIWARDLSRAEQLVAKVGGTAVADTLTVTGK